MSKKLTHVQKMLDKYVEGLSINRQQFLDNIIQNRPQCISSQKVFFAFLFVCAVCRVMWRVKTITKILAELAGCLGSWTLHFFSPACHTGNQFSRNCSKSETVESLLFGVCYGCAGWVFIGWFHWMRSVGWESVG